MKISQILNEFSEGAQPGVAATAAQTPQAQAAAQAIQKGLAVLQQQSPNSDASFNTTDAIQEILPDGTVVMDSNLQPSALQNVRKILALGGGANFKVTMSTQTIPSATGMNTALQAKPGVAEGDRPFRGVGGAFNRGDDERHDLDPTDWYIVKDGKMLVASIYPRQTQQAIAQGFSRTRAEAKSRDNSQGVAEGESDSPVASAITRRILLQRSDLLQKYGPEKVTAAIDDVADFVGDTEEIGSSDVSGWIKQVEQSLAGMTEAGNANSGRRGPDYQDNSPVIPGRVEPLPQGLRHHADASRYGGTEPDDEDDRLLSPQQRHRLHRAVTPGDLDEQEKIAGRYDPDDFDDMIGRLKHLAGAGPLKTVYDPEKRVYKNVPHAVQPAQQPKKAQR